VSEATETTTDLELDTIHEGDTIEWLKQLPSESVDCCVTDPPYCSGAYQEAQKRTTIGMGVSRARARDTGWFFNDSMGSTGFMYLLRMASMELSRILKGGASYLCFTDSKMIPLLVPVVESSGFRWQNTIVWDKGSPAMGNGFRAQHEMVLHFVKGRGTFHNRRLGNVLHHDRIPTKDRGHPTQKPVGLILEMLSVVCPPGGVVIDPFAGAGSHLVGAVVFGAHAIGCERSPGYQRYGQDRIDATKKRMAAGAHHLDLEAATRPQGTQGALFDLAGDAARARAPRGASCDPAESDACEQGNPVVACDSATAGPECGEPCKQAPEVGGAGGDVQLPSGDHNDCDETGAGVDCDDAADAPAARLTRCGQKVCMKCDVCAGAPDQLVPCEKEPTR